MNEYGSEYVSQLPASDTEANNNIEHTASATVPTLDAGFQSSANAVGAAVAAHLGPLLRGLDARLDTLNRLAARLLLQVQQSAQCADICAHAGAVSTPNIPDTHEHVINSTGARDNTRYPGVGSNGAGGPGQKGAPQYEYVGGPAEAGLRREISRYCAEVDRVHFGGVPGKANKAIFCTFGFKSRSQIGLEELGEVLAWAREEWPLS